LELRRNEMIYDPFEYIRNYYEVPAKKGKIVSYNGKLGVITGASSHTLKVRLEGAKHALTYHPSGLKYDIQA
jgi:hypothetical protein